jgi:hypothetical protein
MTPARRRVSNERPLAITCPRYCGSGIHAAPATHGARLACLPRRCIGSGSGLETCSVLSFNTVDPIQLKRPSGPPPNLQFVDTDPGVTYLLPMAGTVLDCAPGAQVEADGSKAYCCKT